MSISDPLAALNVARYAAWQPRFTADNARQAVMAFNGDNVRGRTLSPDELDWAQQHLAILFSACTACCARWTGCSPTAWRWARAWPPTRANLYQFWGRRIAGT